MTTCNTGIREEVVRFARCLYSRGDIVEWRAIKGRNVANGYCLAEELKDRTGVFQEHNGRGLNIYVGANPRKAMGLKGDENIGVCRTVFVDFDKLDESEAYEKQAMRRIENARLPMPTLRVFSGHGIHAYWRLLTAIEPAEWIKVQERLIATLHTDRVIKNPERIMRLPGFENVKEEEGVPCFILDTDWNRVCDVSDILDHCVELPKSEHQDVPVPFLPKSPFMEARARAMLFAAKWPGCTVGERNTAAFLHACQMVNDFSQSDSDALEILRSWNATNTPPLPDEEIQVALRSAKKGAKNPPGCKLTANRPRVTSSSGSPQNTPAESLVRPVKAVSGSRMVAKVIDDTLSGKRRMVEWPWRCLGENTEALVNGTVTALCGSKGATKTFFILQSMSHWLEQGERAAMLVMEEDSEHCLRRVLAQQSGYSGITGSKWIKEHPEEAHAALKEHAAVLDRMGQHLYDLPDSDISLPEIAAWIKEKVDEGYRIIVVDPITAAVQSSDPWIQDASFINGVKRVARDAGVSVVLTTHPKKGSSGLVDMDSLAGSAAWVRFAQTILWLEAHDEKNVVIHTDLGRHSVEINRTLTVLAARNAGGRGKKIGYMFSKDSLTFNELGVIIKEKKVDE